MTGVQTCALPISLAVSSGQAAQFIAVSSLLGQGDEMVASSTLYGGTYTQFDVSFRRLGIQTTFVDSDDPENIESRLGSDDDAEGLISAEKLEKLLEEREAAQFASAENMLRKAIDESKDPELKEIADSLQIGQSPEGLRIQLLDQEKVALFPLGSADMFEQTRKLLAKVSEIIAKLPNKIKISGHTDSRPFPEGATYTNWELSADRALSSRRALIANGIPGDRVAQVVGMADTDPIEPNDPTSPSNRRISIVLLRQDFSDQAAEAVAASSEPAVQPLETTLPPVIAPDNGSALPPVRSGG